MKFLSFIVSLLLLIGCGGGSSGGEQKNPTNEQNNSDTPKLKTINDFYFKQQWYIQKNKSFYSLYNIDDNAHVHGDKYYGRYSGKGVKIAVIDDGLDINHPDLKGSIKDTYSIVTGGKNVAQYVGEKHGTSVTGIIGANRNDIGIFGLANESEIMFLKSSSTMYDEETILLFQKANEFGADIINNSWGSGDVSDVVRETIVNLAKNGRNGNGTLIVFASGNSGDLMEKNGKIDESAIPEVIAVGATSQLNLRSSYSDYGQNLDIMAPGGARDFGLISLAPIALNYYGIFQGTSYSAPLVSGALAMLLEANPNLTRVEIERLLQTTSDKIGFQPYNEKGHNMYYGYGKLNINKLIDAGLKVKK